jgi:hypothetical protein
VWLKYVKGFPSFVVGIWLETLLVYIQLLGACSLSNSSCVAGRLATAGYEVVSSRSLPMLGNESTSLSGRSGSVIHLENIDVVFWVSPEGEPWVISTPSVRELLFETVNGTSLVGSALPIRIPLSSRYSCTSIGSNHSPSNPGSAVSTIVLVRPNTKLSTSLLGVLFTSTFSLPSTVRYRSGWISTGGCWMGPYKSN